MRIVFLMVLSFPLLSFANRMASPLDPLLLTLENPSTLQLTLDCFDPEVTPACPQINQSYCQELAANGGRMSDSTGAVNLGKSEKSAISAIERANLDDIVRALPSLPEHLKTPLAGPINSLKALLENENDSVEWYNSISDARDEISFKITEVAMDRATASLAAKIPAGSSATEIDLGYEIEFQEQTLNEEFTRAKMQASPNWARIGNIYSKVKEDMVAVIETLPLSPEEKQERLAKIRYSEIDIPFGIRTGGDIGRIIESDCRTNMINAFYLSLTGKLTICAGFLNAFQSESALYFTLAHELSHSFNMKFLQGEKSEPRNSRLMSRLIESNSNLSCEEYSTLKASEAVRAPSNYCGTDRYKEFISCLTKNKDLNTAAAAFADMAQTRELYGSGFCAITQADQGLGHMNPHTWIDRNFNSMTGGDQEFYGLPISQARNMLGPAYHIVQEFKCSPTGTECSSVERKLISELPTAPNESACQHEATAASENESDWYAHKAMLLHLRRNGDLKQRRQMVASSMGLFCGYSYMKPLSEEQLRELEKILEDMEDGQTEHSSDEDRINGVMTGEMAELLQCTTPQSVPAPHNYQSCRI